MVYIIVEGKVVIFQDFKYRMGDEDTLFLVNDKHYTQARIITQ